MSLYGLDFYFAFRFRFLSPQEHNLICFTASSLSISCAILWRLSICFSCFLSIRDSAAKSRNSLPASGRNSSSNQILKSLRPGPVHPTQGSDILLCSVYYMIYLHTPLGPKLSLLLPSAGAVRRCTSLWVKKRVGQVQSKVKLIFARPC